MLNHFSVFTWNITNTLMIGNGQAVSGSMYLRGVGAVGVEIFFVISGFSISMSASGLSGAKGALRFLQMRTIRIAPALWISSLIAVAALLIYGVSVATIMPALLHSIFLLPIGPWIDGVIWTLVVEAVFYLLVAGIIFMTPRLNLETLAIIIGMASAIYIFALSFLTLLPHTQGLAALLGRYFFKALLYRHGVFFATGMILWSMKSQGVTALKLSCLPVFVVAGMIEAGLMTDRPFPYAMATALIWLAATAFMFWSVFKAESFTKVIGDSTGTFRFLGDLSYPLYLNHYTTGSVLVMLALSAGLSPLQAAGVGVAGAIALASLVLLAEKPIQRAWKTIWLKSKPST